MKTNFLLVIFATASLSFLASCGEDEPKPADISFEFAENEVTESDGTVTSFHPEIIDDGVGREVEVKITLNRRAPGNIVIKFDLDGNARLEATADDLNDFEILEEGEGITVDDDEITILKGTTEASLKILVFEDLEFEFDDLDLNDDDVPYETVEISLEKIVSGPGKLGTQLEHTLKILEDDAVGFLAWESADMTAEEALIDMDVILWYEQLTWLAGASAGTDIEAFPIPAGLGEGDVGISYTYYSGNSDDVNFQSAFFNTAGTLNGDRYTYGTDDEPLVFGGNYKLVNKNEWSEASPPKIAQTAVKTGIDYDDFSSVETFTEGSRIKTRVPLKLDRKTLLGISAKSRQYKTINLSSK